MKKGINLFVLGLIMFLGCLVDVKAESDEPVFENQETFFYDWETEPVELLNENFLLVEDKAYYEYGYVTTSLEMNDDFFNSVLIKYDIKGNVIAQKKFNNTMLLDIEIYGEYIYAFEALYSNITDETGLYVLILNNDLSIKKQYYFGTDDDMGYLFDDIVYSRIFGFNLIDVDDKGNVLYYSFSNNVVFQFGENGILQMDDDVFNNYYLYVNRFLSINDRNNAYYGYDKKNKTEVMSGSVSEDMCLNPIFYYKGVGDIGSISKCEQVGAIKLFVDGKEEWTHTYSYYAAIVEPQLVDSYIVALGITEEATFEVIVVDLEGNLLQKVTESENYLFITGGDKSFMVLALNPNSSANCIIEDDLSSTSSTCYDINNEVWYLPLKIETKVTGSGTVTVVDTSRYGEDVVFTVIPEDGYVLDAVKVTDSSGNVIIFKENTFTMPNTDVLIEAVFVVENPDTYDIALPFIVILGVIFGIVIINKVKVIKWIKS